ncbi:hypothetical protein [Cellulomonas sp. GbtcB1]|uniref:hypothetical protein n=1 Tax=Cellulomonas sp. GbtcB1 TaxID=2824746 RepID=UPI001C2F25F7|nr:hypothetical protein [Cellulomonas sp. GbtcB1]
MPWLATCAALLLCAYAQLESQRFSSALDDRTSGGHYVLTVHSVDADEPAEIRVSSCEALVSDPRVERAGILRDGRLVAVPQLGADQRLIEASTGLFPQLLEADALVGPRLPAVSGALIVDGRPLRPLRLEEQPRGVDVNSSVVLPVRAFQQVHSDCVVVLRPLVRVDQAAADLIAGLDARGALTASGPGLGAADLGALYVERGERWLGIAVGVLGGLVSALINRFRAPELAVYRLSGTSRVDAARLVAYEQLVAAGFFVATISASACLLGQRLTAPTALLWWAFAGAAAWFITSVAVSLPVVLRNPVTAVRDD